MQRVGNRDLEREIAIEVNGVFHYARNNEMPLGKDIIKQRLLSKLGYRVMTVSYFDWAILEVKDRRSYLEMMI